MSVDWLYCVRARDPFGLTTTCPLMGFPGAQMVKNPPAVQETWVRFLGWEDLLEEGKATHFSILESPEDSPENPHGEKSLVGYSQWSHKESDTTE